MRLPEIVQQRAAETPCARFGLCVGGGVGAAYLGRHVERAGWEASCRADARAAAAPWASAIGDRGLWLLAPLANVLAFPEAAL